MKKKSGSRTVHVFKRIFNLHSWFDWDRMKAFTLYLINGIKIFLVPQKNKTTESFEAAKNRLHLTDQELLKRQKGLFRLSILMVCFAFLLFGYAIYQLVTGGILGFVLACTVMSIALVLAFRYHFWYFQIKERKLGCSLQEWYQKGIKGGK